VVSGFFRLVGQLLRCLHVRELDAKLSVGLDDPAETGMLYALLWPVLIPLNHPALSRVQLEPNFGGRMLQFTGLGNVRLVPLELLPPVPCRIANDEFG
jgi:hypothetical protein